MMARLLLVAAVVAICIGAITQESMVLALGILLSIWAEVWGTQEKLCSIEEHLCADISALTLSLRIWGDIKKEEAERNFENELDSLEPKQENEV
jgi:hypothetical protein|tara:strand:- start:3861 stop:4142 length:282 start_codon:yes stop_codon:yes gene_type:complete